jgi:uncharacterized membrane protein YgdD (TMEM256/DUF423 family)
MTTHRKFIAAGATFALMGVILGAFGAHALDELLLKNETKDAWNTAVSYQMWHASALILCGLLQNKGQSYKPAALCFGLGILLFSGSIYALSLGGPRWLGPITPLGGLSFIVAWALVVAAQFRKNINSDD